MTPREAIREFLGRHLRMQSVRDGDDIFATGYVNSLFAMQLVTFVEKQFGVTVEPAELRLDNFRSVDALVAFVARVRGDA
jgi:acyl carrier protein